MSAILNSLNAHNLPIFQPILMKPISKFMVYRALSDKIFLSLGLLSPLTAIKTHISFLAYFLYESGYVLLDFINLTQVHNFTVSAQDILPSVDIRYLP